MKEIQVTKVYFSKFSVILEEEVYISVNSTTYFGLTMIANDSKEKYPFALISSNFTFDEWKNREEGFQCTGTSPSNQYVMLCEDKWKSVFDDLDLHKEGAAQAALTLNIVLVLIAAQLALILGLVVYILRNHAGGTESKLKSKIYSIPSEMEIYQETGQTPIITKKINH